VREVNCSITFTDGAEGWQPC